MKQFIFLILIAFSLTACVSQKKYAELQAEVERLRVAEPIEAATEETEQMLVEDMKNQVQELRNQLGDAMRSLEKMQMLQEAGSIKQPTPEQMEAYRLQHDQEMQEMEGKMIQDEQENNLISYYTDAQMDLRVIEAGCVKAVEGYTKKQVNVNLVPGQLDVVISTNELFEENKTSLNENGTSLLNKLSVAINVPNQVPYEVVTISSSLDKNQVELATERGVNIQRYLSELETSINDPFATSITSCEKALGRSNSNCDKVILRFRTKYEELIEHIDRAQIR